MSQTTSNIPQSDIPRRLFIVAGQSGLVTAVQSYQGAGAPDPLPDGMTEIYDAATWNHAARNLSLVTWDGATLQDVLSPLQIAVAAQIAVLRSACSAAITGGYASSALGAPHTYPSTQIDQSNMIASVTASLLPNLPADWTTPFWCRAADGTWGLAQHSIAQIQQAGLDGKSWVAAQQVKLRQLAAQALAATTPAAAAAVTWA